MESVSVTEFKAKCVGLIKRVQQTGRPLTVTRRGKPQVVVSVVRIEPKQRVLGLLAGTAQLKGDIVHSEFSNDWESNR